jgi:hypothetical protein
VGLSKVRECGYCRQIKKTWWYSYCTVMVFAVQCGRGFEVCFCILEVAS